MERAYWSNWIVDIVKEVGYKCPTCESDFKKSGLEGIGIRNAFNNASKHVFYIQYHCPKCKGRNIVELHEMTLIDLANCIIEHNSIDEIEKILEDQDKHTNSYNNNIKPKAKKKQSIVKKSKISIKEAQAARRMLNECDSHEAFLRAIGVSYPVKDNISDCDHGDHFRIYEEPTAND